MHVIYPTFPHTPPCYPDWIGQWAYRVATTLVPPGMTNAKTNPCGNTEPCRSGHLKNLLGPLCIICQREQIGIFSIEVLSPITKLQEIILSCTLKLQLLFRLNNEYCHKYFLSENRGINVGLLSLGKDGSALRMNWPFQPFSLSNWTTPWAG